MAQPDYNQLYSQLCNILQQHGISGGVVPDNKATSIVASLVKAGYWFISESDVSGKNSAEIVQKMAKGKSR